MVCGGKDKKGKITNEVLKLEIPSFKLNKFSSMVKPHFHLDFVTKKSSVIAIDNRINSNEGLDETVVSVEIYSEETKTWTQNYVRIDERICYCVCYFMSKLYLIGGWINSSHECLNSCHTYDINSQALNKVANLNKARDCAACTVFKGKIVVTGGESDWSTLKSVEAYDYFENKWTYLPDMIEERYYHASVSIGNKLFVIGGVCPISCEVFDSFSRKFTSINSALLKTKILYNCKGFCIGYKIVVFSRQLNYSETS